MIAKLFPYILRWKGWFGLAVCTLILRTVSDMTLVYYLNRIVTALLNKDNNSLAPLAIIIFLCAFIGVVSIMIGRYSSTMYAVKCTKKIRDELVASAADMSISRKGNYTSGHSSTVFSSDTSDVQEFLEIHLPNLIYQPLIFISSLVYLSLIDWQFLLLVSFIVPLSSYAVQKISKPIERGTKESQRVFGSANSMVGDLYYGVKEIKNYNLASYWIERYKHLAEKVLIKQLAVSRSRSWIRGVTVAVQSIPFIICLYFGGQRVLQGEMRVEDLLIFIYLLNYLVQPITVIQSAAAQIQITRAAVSRIFDMIATVPEQGNKQVRKAIESNPTVNFNNVTFSYENGAEVTKSGSFIANKGSITALCGASGSGKSSIFNLLCGFIQPQSGKIQIAGRSITETSIEDYRNSIAIVTQEQFLIPGTIKDNIALGDPDASDKEIIEAAIIAGADEFIQSLPYSYDTQIQERGKNLSGGQMQRLAIARAYLKKAPVLLLDEPSSALDAQSEASLWAALAKMKERMAIIVITHHLSMLRHVDQVLYLNKGKLHQGKDLEGLKMKEVNGTMILPSGEGMNI
ncbi:ABC transporter ATP-binding protein [Paenibacillus taichungensis]|uniref:ABC transporter ATP-binding protein n=1 Tax=Paenibacillus taichungensis TaxID=484184 RepID=UPI0027B9B823|nr:ABC transporter ATP-binding protein [Paenibacillus taichungensis]